MNTIKNLGALIALHISRTGMVSTSVERLSLFRAD